jgi:hypothetical protein
VVEVGSEGGERALLPYCLLGGFLARTDGRIYVRAFRWKTRTAGQGAVSGVSWCPSVTQGSPWTRFATLAARGGSRDVSKRAYGLRRVIAGHCGSLGPSPAAMPRSGPWGRP